VSGPGEYGLDAVKELDEVRKILGSYRAELTIAGCVEQLLKERFPPENYGRLTEESKELHAVKAVLGALHQGGRRVSDVVADLVMDLRKRSENKYGPIEYDREEMKRFADLHENSTLHNLLFKVDQRNRDIGYEWVTIVHDGWRKQILIHSPLPYSYRIPTLGGGVVELQRRNILGQGVVYS
jgi:hypothetical protein